LFHTHALPKVTLYAIDGTRIYMLRLTAPSPMMLLVLSRL